MAGENLLQWRGQVRGSAVTAAAGIQAALEQSTTHMHPHGGAHLRYSHILREQLTVPREKAHKAILT